MAGARLEVESGVIDRVVNSVLVRVGGRRGTIRMLAFVVLEKCVASGKRSVAMLLVADIRSFASAEVSHENSSF